MGGPDAARSPEDGADALYQGIQGVLGAGVWCRCAVPGHPGCAWCRRLMQKSKKGTQTLAQLQVM